MSYLPTGRRFIRITQALHFRIGPPREWPDDQATPWPALKARLAPGAPTASPLHRDNEVERYRIPLSITPPLIASAELCAVSTPNNIGAPVRLLNVTEAADRLGLSISFLNKVRLTGGGPPFAKIGTRVLYDPADLATWVADRKRESTGGSQ